MATATTFPLSDFDRLCWFIYLLYHLPLHSKITIHQGDPHSGLSSSSHGFWTLTQSSSLPGLSFLHLENECDVCSANWVWLGWRGNEKWNGYHHFQEHLKARGRLSYSLIEILPTFQTYLEATYFNADSSGSGVRQGWGEHPSLTTFSYVTLKKPLV